MASIVTSWKPARCNIAPLLISKLRPAPSSLVSTAERALSIETWSAASKVKTRTEGNTVFNPIDVSEPRP